MFNLIIFVEVSSQIHYCKHKVDGVNLINRKDSGAQSAKRATYHPLTVETFLDTSNAPPAKTL
jgi:hypothetical protein